MVEEEQELAHSIPLYTPTIAYSFVACFALYRKFTLKMITMSSENMK